MKIKLLSSPVWKLCFQAEDYSYLYLRLFIRLIVCLWLWFVLNIFNQLGLRHLFPRVAMSILVYIYYIKQKGRPLAVETRRCCPVTSGGTKHLFRGSWWTVVSVWDRRLNGENCFNIERFALTLFQKHANILTDLYISQTEPNFGWKESFNKKHERTLVKYSLPAGLR